MSTSTRYHGLDAARAIALLLGVSLHAACSFIPYSIGWAVRDVSATPAMVVFFDVIHIFRMSLFFLIAGFFAHLSFERKGRSAFFRDRLKRIVVPLIGGWLAIYPFVVCAWIWAAQRGGGGLTLAPELAHLPAPILTIGAFLTGKVFDNGLHLVHFWFLYYLALIYVALFAGRAVFYRFGGGRATPPVDRWVRRCVESPGGLALLATPVAAVLFLQPAGVGPGLGALEPIPPPLNWSFLAYLWVFLVGWLIFRQPDLVAAIERLAPRNAILAAVLSVPLAARTLWLGEQLLSADPRGLLERILYSAGYAVALWSWTLGFTGLCLRHFARPNRVWRYVADSSYWIYLTHFPLVAFVQIAIAELPWHWALKFALIHAIVLPPLFWSYHYLVRPTWIGAILNGRRRGRGAPQASAEAGPVSQPAEAAPRV